MLNHDYWWQQDAEEAALAELQGGEPLGPVQFEWNAQLLVWEPQVCTQS